MHSRIPKRIIQTGKHVSQPLLNRAMMANIRALNPDYEYLFFDNQGVEDFFEREFPQYRKIFESFQLPIQRYDFFRYLAVYRFGGFYFDLDVLLASGLSELLDFGCVFPFEGLTLSRYLRNHHDMDWEVGNYAFGAAPGHPFLKAVIENCVKAQQDPVWVKPMMQGSLGLISDEYYVLNSTGPGLVSRTLAENPDLAGTVKVLFPEDVCDVGNWNQFGDLGVHLMDGSWRLKTSFWRRKFTHYWETFELERLLKQSRRLGKKRHNFANGAAGMPGERTTPLVSILIPAYNAEKWISDTIRSALEQTWPNKEIIVVDDGSTDRTLAVAQQFAPEHVRVATQKNQGAAAARNTAFSLCSGEYIQWLDADDLLAPDKIARQMDVASQCGNKLTLLSCPWGRFIYRTSKAEFMPTGLWRDLRPIEWLLLKLGHNLYMQTATWLVTRALTEAAGPWNTDLLGDDDGEYFCRVLLASSGTRFVRDAKVYYRGPGVAFGGTLSYVWESEKKLEAHWRSMQYHIQYIRSLENSDRVREACLAYLHMSLAYFYPDRVAILQQAEQLAISLGRPLLQPSFRGKYYWIEKMFGWRATIRMQVYLRKLRWTVQMQWDRMLFRIEGHLSGKPPLRASGYHST